jgi:hypothetical protein
MPTRWAWKQGKKWRRTMQYKKELIRELRDVAVLFHASQELPYKLLEVLDKHLPHIGDVCCERGCIEYEEKNI